ncbi:MAG: response regulator [Desulfobulbaceae bacterium]
MDAGLIERIFEPYFTTKKKGEGTGLGLSVVHGIIKNIGGHITVYSEPGRGTAFHVYLPVQSQAKTVAPEQERTMVLPGGNERILLIDDEEAIVRSGERILQGLGYTVDGFTDCEAAKATFLRNPARYDLIITDMNMPRTSGAELSQVSREARPDIRIILCTGFSELINKDKAEKLGISRLLMKPLTAREMASAIRQVLDNRDGEPAKS